MDQCIHCSTMATCGDALDAPRSEVIAGDAFTWIEKARDLDALHP